MHMEGEEQQNSSLQKRGNKSFLDRVKEDEGMFRHRIESLPGKRPNSKCYFTVQMYIFS